MIRLSDFGMVTCSVATADIRYRHFANIEISSSFLHVIDVSEIFPFVLSIGIAVQGIIYIACQTKGLEGLLILGCTSISQAMLPGKILALDTTLTLLLTTATSFISCSLYPTFLWAGDNRTGAEAAAVSTNI